MRWPFVRRSSRDRDVALAFNLGWRGALLLELPAEYCTACGGPHDDDRPHVRIAPGDDPELDRIQGLIT